MDKPFISVCFVLSRYRPIELYEVIIPRAEVVIGKEREPKEWADEVEEFCNK